MKKFLVLAAVVLGLGVTSANAQAGKVYIGTTGLSFGQNGVYGAANNFGLMTGFAISDKVSAFGLAPEIGFFVTNDVALGLGVGFTTISGDNAAALGGKGTSWGLAPYVRWYAYRSGAFSFYLQGEFDYASYKADGQDAINAFEVGAMPGIAYNLSDHFAINATFGMLGYSKVKDEKGTFGLNIDMSSLNFGLSYTF